MPRVTINDTINLNLQSHGTTFRALEVIYQVATTGAESAVYDCFVGHVHSPLSLILRAVFAQTPLLRLLLMPRHRTVTVTDYFICYSPIR